MVDYVKQLLEANDLCGGTYIEPYAGGASVALSLLYSQHASKIKINDIDRSIYAFWYCVPDAECGGARDCGPHPSTPNEG